MGFHRLLATLIPCEYNIANTRIPIIPEVGKHVSSKRFKPNNVKNASGVAGHPSMIESNAQFAILFAIHAIKKTCWRRLPFLACLRGAWIGNTLHNILQSSRCCIFYTVNTTYDTEPWTVDINLHETVTVRFKWDTKADVSGISSDDYTRLRCRL